VSAPAVALGIVAAVLAGTVGLALYGVRRINMDPREYIVGNRSFGTVLLWVLMAGEIYTSFTFLGAAGWAYAYGAPAFYIIAYGGCAYVIGYFLLPPVWRIAKERGLLTGADLFAACYRSRALGIAVGALQFVVLVPYVTLQLQGLQLLLRAAGYETFDTTVAVAAAFVVIAAFVLVAGLRGTAWASVVKDLLVIAGVIFAGIVIPLHFFGSWNETIDRVLAARPQALLLPRSAAVHGTVWFVSTVMLSAVSFFMSPAAMNATYSARSENALRRNAMLLPLYQIVLLLMIFAGLSASLIVPGLHGTAVDRSFLMVTQRYYPPWVMGFVAAAGALAALVPAGALLLAAASVFVKNVLGPFGIATGDAARLRVTRLLVIVVALLALAYWLEAQRTLVELLLIYYSGIAQFVPGVLSALVWRRATAWGVGAGITVGMVLAVGMQIAGIAPGGINPAAIALLANAVVMVAVSITTPQRH
jgi:SSS family solute:Na+ symporter